MLGKPEEADELPLKDSSRWHNPLRADAKAAG